MNNLKLVRTENFENTIPCDFWGDINGEYFVTREQIGTALGYSNPNKSIDKIHTRHKNRLDKFSTTTKLGVVEGERYVERERTLYSRKGIMEICRWSNKPLADKFMDWCWEVIDSLIAKSINKNTELASLVDGIIKQNSLILSQNRSLENKVTRLESMISSLLPPTKHSNWKKQVGIKIKAMKLIRTEHIKYERLYDKLENCVGCADKFIEQANIDPMINMLEMMCGDINKLISLYIFDANWGNEPCYLKDQKGNKLPFKTLEDLYNALKLPYWCRLELFFNNSSK